MGGLAVSPVVIADACLFPYAGAGGVVGLVACAVGAVHGPLPLPILEPAAVVVRHIVVSHTENRIELTCAVLDRVVIGTR